MHFQWTGKLLLDILKVFSTVKDSKGVHDIEATTVCDMRSHHVPFGKMRPSVGQAQEQVPGPVQRFLRF